MARRKKEEDDRFRPMRLTFAPEIYNRIMMLPRGYRSKAINRLVEKYLDNVLVELIQEERNAVEAERVATDEKIGQLYSVLTASSE
jgi:hypothetical protein